MDKDHRLIKRQVKLEKSAQRFQSSRAAQTMSKPTVSTTNTSANPGNFRGGVTSAKGRHKDVRSQYEEPDVVLVGSHEIHSDDSDGSDIDDSRGYSRSNLTSSHQTTRSEKTSSAKSTNEVTSEAHSNLKKLAKSGNHLLQFHYAPIRTDGPRDPLPRRRANISSLPYKRERFLQANYRFMVSPGDFAENITDADSIIEWEHVEQVLYPTPIEYECVICLFPPTCAKIARCGHVFCHSCMLRYFTYLQQGTHSMPCPICLKERIFLKDLKSVQFLHVPKYVVGDSIRFELISRPKHVNSLSVCAPNPDTAAVDDTLLDDELPVWGDRHSVFNRLVVTYDISEIQRREALELEDAIKLADSSREDSLPFLLASQENLIKKAKDIEPIVGVQRLLHAERIAQHMTRRKPAPATEDDHYFFYQSSDGQHLFLHPINVKWMVLEFGSHSKFPFEIEARILDSEEMSQSEQTRKRYKYLGHLPISCDFKFVLVDLENVLVTPQNKEGFKEDVRVRAEQISQKRVEQERKLKAHAKKPADPYRLAMEYHFAPPSAALEDQFDLGSTEAFPTVSGVTVEASSNPAPSEPQPKRSVWASGPSTKVKNVADEFPALPGFGSPAESATAGPKPVVPAAAAGVWGKSTPAAPVAAAPKQAMPASQQSGGGRKKKKMLVLLSTPQQKS